MSTVASLVGVKLVPVGIVILMLYGTADIIKLVDRVDAHDSKITQIESDKKELLKTVNRMDKNISAIKEHLRVRSNDESE